MPWLGSVGGVDSVDRVLQAITLVYVLTHKNASLPCCCQHAKHAVVDAAASVLRLHAMRNNDAAVCQNSGRCCKQSWELLMGRTGLQAHVQVFLNTRLQKFRGTLLHLLMSLLSQSRLYESASKQVGCALHALQRCRS